MTSLLEIEGSQWLPDDHVEPVDEHEHNEYCTRCNRHLGMPFHDTNEHDEAVALVGED